MRQAVILSGGKGTRLQSAIGNMPKSLAAVGDTTVLGLQLRLLEHSGFTEAVLLVGHEAHQIRTWLAENRPSRLALQIIDDGDPRGTAGAVLAALPQLADTFLVMYGDTVLGVDLERFWHWHSQEPQAAASLFLHPNDHPHDSDLVEIDDAGRVLCFHPYPHPPGAWLPNLVNAALYVVNREALKPWAALPPPVDFGKHLFPKMLSAGALLRGYNSPEFVKDAGTPSRLCYVRDAYESGLIDRSSLHHPQKAVFIDRDGTLNEDTGWISRAEDLLIYDFVGPALRRLNESEWRTIVVTNQPVIARGELTEAELRRMHARLDMTVATNSAYFDRVYYCPHHPDGGFAGEIPSLKIPCSCRKPDTGLIERAKKEFNLDLSESWFVGDSTADIGTAENAGISSITVETGNGGLDGKHPYEPQFTTGNFDAAVDFILNIYPKVADRVLPLLGPVQPAQDWFVGGLARSGKSSIAAAMLRELRRRGIRAELIHLDRWILSNSERGPTVFGRFAMTELENLVAVLQTRSRGGGVTLELPTYDRRTQPRGHSTLTKIIGPQTVLIWEGVIAVELARRAGVLDCAVHVSTNEGQRKLRFLRYYARRGKSSADALRLFDERQCDEHVPVLELGKQARWQVTLDGAMMTAEAEAISR